MDEEPRDLGNDTKFTNHKEARVFIRKLRNNSRAHTCSFLRKFFFLQHNNEQLFPNPNFPTENLDKYCLIESFNSQNSHF